MVIHSLTSSGLSRMRVDDRSDKNFCKMSSDHGRKSLVKNTNLLPKAETAKLLKKRRCDGVDSLNTTTPPSKRIRNASTSDLDAVEQGTNSKQDNQPITDSDHSSHQTSLDVNKEGEITVTESVVGDDELIGWLFDRS
eukprot:7101942-Ditylum_brightwellii.AAC.1